MRLLVCAGMTGGGVYPALAVLQAMKSKTEDIMWIGSKSGMEATLLKSYSVQSESISSAGLHGVGFRALPGNLIQLFKGWGEAKTIIKRFKPDVMFFTGGYVGVPVAHAGRDIPSVVFVPDIEPGLALKTIMRFAEKVAVSVEAAKQYIQDSRVTLTGYPIRKELESWNRQNSRGHFRISQKDKVLLVFGGSKGARSINQALVASLKEFLSEMHVIHITGSENWEGAKALLKKFGKAESRKYHIFPYLHDDMGAAFCAADLAVCRAGASTLGELPFFGLPAILVPYPHAWRYQHRNAEYLQKNGAAVIMEDKDLNDQLLTKVLKTMEDGEKLSEMRKAMKTLFIPDAADRIADLIISTGESHRQKEVFYG